MDRDRDRVLTWHEISNVFQKYRLTFPQESSGFIQGNFIDETYGQGLIHYENLMEAFSKVRKQKPKDEAFSENWEHDINVQKEQRLQRIAKGKLLSRPDTFVDRDEAKIILELETILEASPKFDLQEFRNSMISKDSYGVGTVRRQIVLQAASWANLNLEHRGTIVANWLSQCDKQGNGNYNIDMLVSYLERSRPNVVNRIRKSSSAVALAQSCG